MSAYYCIPCARAMGHLSGLQTSSLLGSTYQHDKFAKHTAPSTCYQVASVFRDPSTAAYSAYFVSASTSGTLEIDDIGRKNLIVFAGKTVGARYDVGQFVLDQQSVKIVNYSDQQRIHAFSVSSSGAGSQVCARCGMPTPI